MKTAAIYARVSSDKQKEENTIASQTAALTAFAAEQGYAVPTEWIFEDEGYSGASLIRPGLETAERVLMRVGKTPQGRRPTSAAEAKAPTATRGRLGRPPKAATSKSAGRKLSAPSLGERVLALATGKTRQELYVACPNDRPNHIGMAVQRHIRAGRIHERDGKLYVTSPAAEQAHATA